MTSTLIVKISLRRFDAGTDNTAKLIGFGLNLAEFGWCKHFAFFNHLKPYP